MKTPVFCSAASVMVASTALFTDVPATHFPIYQPIIEATINSPLMDAKGDTYLIFKNHRRKS